MTWRALGLALVAMALGIAAAFGWVGVYSALIEPGQSDGAYQDYAQRTAPIVAIVTGFPLMLVFGWLNARGLARQDAVWAGLLVGIWYVAFDAAILLATGAGLHWSLVALSYVLRLAGAGLGGWLASRRI